MKILHLRASNFYGGPERQVHYHAKLCQSAECTVTVGSFTEAGRTPPFLEVIARDGVPTKLFEVRSAYDPKTPALVKTFLKEGGFDILCTHDYRTHLVGWLATRRTGVRWIAFSRGWTRENLKVKLYHTLDKIIIRFADRIVAVSGAQKQKLQRLLISAKKISVVLNAVALDAVMPKEATDLRTKFGFPSDSIIVIAGGRFSAEKGQAVLVHAAAAAVKEEPRLRFLLFGEGPDEEKIRRMTASLRLEGHLLCPGFEKNMTAAIAGADMLVNPSLSEGLPNIVLEAMALGVPVVATRVGGVPEIMRHRTNGLLVPPGDVSALKEAILELCRTPSLRQEIAEHALNYVKETLTFDAQNRKLMEIYQGVLKKTL